MVPLPHGFGNMAGNGLFGSLSFANTVQPTVASLTNNFSKINFQPSQMINANAQTFNKTNDEKNTVDIMLDLKWGSISEDLMKTIRNTIIYGMFNILKFPMLFLYIIVTF